MSSRSSPGWKRCSPGSPGRPSSSTTIRATARPRMFEALKGEALDIVIGSRYAAGGGVGDWDKSRARISDLATRLSRLVVKAELSDPMSGFFMIRRPAFEAALRALSGQGFKILIDLFAS